MTTALQGQIFNCNGKAYNTASLPAWARDLIASLDRQRMDMRTTIDRQALRLSDAHEIIAEGIEVHDELVKQRDMYRQLYEDCKGQAE